MLPSATRNGLDGIAEMHAPSDVCASCNYDGVQGVSRMGRNAGGIHSFACSSCGGIAATIELVDGSGPLNLGAGPDDKEMLITFGGPELRMRLTWLGIASGPVIPEVAQLLASKDDLDPLLLFKFDSELGALLLPPVQSELLFEVLEYPADLC